MSKTTVVNKTVDTYDEYIGRGSPFGSPFVIGPDGNRTEVIEKYKQYFTDRISRSDRFLKAVFTLKGKKLGCFCAPAACHGDVIAEYLNTHKITDFWRSPQQFYDYVDNIFHFTLDPCATKSSSKCDTYYTEEDNGLTQPWAGHVVYCNPPYSNVKPWLAKANEECLENNVVSMVLTHAAFATVWARKYIALPHVKLWAFNPRIQFEAPPGMTASSNARDSMAFIFRPEDRAHQVVNLFSNEKIKFVCWK